MKRYTKDDLMKYKNEKGFYLPKELFEGLKYKGLRLETKLAYCALFDTLIHKPSYDKTGSAFIKSDNPSSIKNLQELANKEVDAQKMNAYINELLEAELIEMDKQNIYFGEL